MKYLTQAQQHGRAMRARGKPYRGGYTREEIRAQSEKKETEKRKWRKIESEHFPEADIWTIKGKKDYSTILVAPIRLLPEEAAVFGEPLQWVTTKDYTVFYITGTIDGFYHKKDDASEAQFKSEKEAIANAKAVMIDNPRGLYEEDYNKTSPSTFSKKDKGWFNEPKRHSLARKGIKTRKKR